MTTTIVKEILQNYDGMNPCIKANLYKLLMHGKLAGTGKNVDSSSRPRI